VGNKEVAYNRGGNNKDRVEGSGKARKVGVENIFCKYRLLILEVIKKMKWEF